MGKLYDIDKDISTGHKRTCVYPLCLRAGETIPTESPTRVIGKHFMFTVTLSPLEEVELEPDQVHSPYPDSKTVLFAAKSFVDALELSKLWQNGETAQYVVRKIHVGPRVFVRDFDKL
jgi:hypothetical protein